MPFEVVFGGGKRMNAVLRCRKFILVFGACALEDETRRALKKKKDFHQPQRFSQKMQEGGAPAPPTRIPTCSLRRERLSSSGQACDTRGSPTFSLQRQCPPVVCRHHQSQLSPPHRSSSSGYTPTMPPPPPPAQPPQKGKFVHPSAKHAKKKYLPLLVLMTQC